MKIQKFLVICLTNFLLLILSSRYVFAGVLINEIFPHPATGDDWIELYKSDQEEVDISSWKIEDSTGVAKTFTDGTKIASTSSFYQVSLSNRLNNGGDIVRLKDNNGNTVDEKSYSSVEEDIALGRFPDGSSNWGVLTTSTPNSTNSSLVLSSPTPSITPSPNPTNTPAPKPNTPTNTPIPSATPTPNRILSLTPTPKVTKTVTPTIAPNPTVSLTPTPTDITGSVLGEQDYVSTQSAGNQNKKGWVIVLILIGLGSICIGTAVFLSFKTVKQRKNF